jgi:hypothetical protein
VCRSFQNKSLFRPEKSKSPCIAINNFLHSNYWTLQSWLTYKDWCCVFICQSLALTCSLLPTHNTNSNALSKYPPLCNITRMKTMLSYSQYCIDEMPHLCSMQVWSSLFAGLLGFSTSCTLATSLQNSLQLQIYKIVGTHGSDSMLLIENPITHRVTSTSSKRIFTHFNACPTYIPSVTFLRLFWHATTHSRFNYKNVSHHIHECIRHNSVRSPESFP